MWPPSIENIKPMDFAIWSILDIVMSRLNLKNVLLASWSVLDEEEVQRSSHSVASRLELISEVFGDHFEI